MCTQVVCLLKLYVYTSYVIVPCNYSHVYSCMCTQVVCVHKLYVYTQVACVHKLYVYTSYIVSRLNPV